MKKRPLTEVIRRVVDFDDRTVPLEQRLGERVRNSPPGSRIGYDSTSHEPGPMFCSILTEEQINSIQTHPKVMEIMDKVRSQAVSEGLESARSEIDQMRERCAESVVNLNSAAKNAAKWVASEVVELALMVATEVLRHECTQDQERLKMVIEESLLSFSDGEEVTLRMNPVDAQFIRERHPEMESPSITLLEDDSLVIGGLVLQSARRVVDASIEAQTEGVRGGLVDFLSAAKSEVAPEKSE